VLRYEFRYLRREEPAPKGAGSTVPSSTHKNSSARCFICRMGPRTNADPPTAPAKGILPLGLLDLWLRQLVFIPLYEFLYLRRQKPAPEGAGFTVPSSTHEDSLPKDFICRIELRLKHFGSGVPATLISHS